MHLERNVIDSTEYQKQLIICENTIKNSPNRLEEAEKLDNSFIIPSSNSAGKIKQVMFRSKSNENASQNAKILISRLNQEKKEREQKKLERIQKDQIRLSKVNSFFILFRRLKNKRSLKPNKKMNYEGE